MDARGLVTGTAVAAVLVAAALVGWTVAGPPRAPVSLPAQACPRSAADAAPGTGPSSVLLVPYGPVSGRVCLYRTPPGADPTAGTLAASGALDPTAAAELSGLLHPLPDAPGVCGTAGPADAPSPSAVSAAVLLRYRPGTVPTVGEELRLWLSGPAPCAFAGNGTRTVAVDATTAARLVDVAPALAALYDRG